MYWLVGFVLTYLNSIFQMARTITTLTRREVRRNQLREEIQEIEYKSAYGVDGHVRRLDRLFWKLEQEEFPVLDSYRIWALMHSLPEYPRVIADYVWGRHQGRVTYSVLCEELLHHMGEEEPEESEEDQEMLEEDPEMDLMENPEAAPSEIIPNESRLIGIVLAAILVFVLVGAVLAYLVY